MIVDISKCLLALLLANGGGEILTPPADLLKIAPGSVKVVLPDVRARHVAVAADGSVHVATDRGVALRSGDAWTWLDRATAGLPEDAVTRVMPAVDGLWIGFASGGLARRAGGKVERFDAGDEVLDLAMHGGQVWALTERGLFRFESGKPARYTGGEGFPGGQVTSLAVGSDGRLWVGTDTAEVAAFDGRAWVKHGFRGKVVGRIVRCVAPVGDHIWFGTMGSLNVFEPSTGRLDDETAEKPAIFSSRVITTILHAGGDVLVGSEGGGLYRFAQKSQQWRLFNDTNGLPSPTVYGVAVHGTTAWVATSGGVAAIDLSR